MFDKQKLFALFFLTGQMNQVDKLKFLCCSSFAKHDNVEMLQPIIDMLPMDIVEYLLTKLEDFQISRLHANFSVGAKFQRLFVQKYWHLIRNEDAQRISNSFRKRNDLNKQCLRYWKIHIAAVLRKPEKIQTSLMLHLCAKVPHLVQRLYIVTEEVNDASLALLSQFSNVKCLSFSVRCSSDVQKLIVLAENWSSLQKIEINLTDEGTEMWQSVKDFLQNKLQENKGIVIWLRISILKPSYLYLINLFSFLEDTIHSIAGLDVGFPGGPVVRDEWMQIYSKVKCIKKLKLRHFVTNRVSLLDITDDAPAYTSDDNALSKLHLKFIKLSLVSYLAFQHWRFSRLEYFYISFANIGHEGAALLAKHAVFWPFVKRVTLRRCHIPDSGFLLLLPAMVHGRGCEKLTQLDLRQNECHDLAFEALHTFLNVKQVTNLKEFAMLRIRLGNSLLPTQFLTAIQKLPLAYLNMSEVHFFNLAQFHQLLHCLLSKSGSMLQEVLLCMPSWFIGDLEQHKKDLKSLVENHNLVCVHINNIETQQQEEVYIEGNGRCILLSIHKAFYM